MARMNRRMAILLPVLLTGIGMDASAREIKMDGYAAIVNDRIITVGEVIETMKPIESQLRLRYSEDELREKIRDVYREIRDSLVHQALVLEEFDHMEKAQIPEKAVDEQINKVISDRFNGSQEQFMEALREENVTMQEFRDRMRDQIIVMILRQREVLSKLSISPGQVRSAYEQHIDEFRTPPGVKPRMIVLYKGDGDAADDVKRSEAEDILARLREGADFIEVAKKHSEGRHADQGGEWGWVDPTEFRAELREAIDGLQPGGPPVLVETDEVIYIVRLEGRRAAGVKSFEEVRDQIEQRVRSQQEERIFNEWMDRLKNKYYVKIFNMPGTY